MGTSLSTSFIIAALTTASVTMLVTYHWCSSSVKKKSHHTKQQQSSTTPSKRKTPHDDQEKSRLSSSDDPCCCCHDTTLAPSPNVSAALLKDLVKHPKSSGKLILLRHGQSVWNRKPTVPDATWRYAGSIDVPLSHVGIDEALEAGEKLRDIPIDICFSSELSRAKTTLTLALSVHSSGRIPLVQKNCCPLQQATYIGVNDSSPETFMLPLYLVPVLRERHFGLLQGVANDSHATVCGPESISRFRNDFDAAFPQGESCADVSDRVIPYLETHILPHVKVGRNVLVAAHGFTLRTIIKYLEQMDRETWQVQMGLEKTHPSECRLLAPTGVPLTYRYDTVTETFVKARMSALDRSESLERSFSE